MLWGDTEFLICSPGRNGPRINTAADGKSGTLDVFVRGTPSIIRQAEIDFLGVSSIKTSGGTNYYSRTQPFYLGAWTRDDPGNEGVPYMVCSGVQVVEQFGVSGVDAAHEDYLETSLPCYRFAKLTLSFMAFRYKTRIDTDVQCFGSGVYGALPDESNFERYVSIQPRPMQRVITAPPGSYRFVKSSVGGEGEVAAIPATFGVPVPENGEEIAVTHHRLPEIPWARITSGMGAINSTEFYGKAAGTLRADPPDISVGVQADGRFCYDLTWRLVYLPKLARTNSNGATAGVTAYGHNALLSARVSSGANIIEYRYATSTGNSGGDRIHRSVEFRDLFRPDP